MSNKKKPTKKVTNPLILRQRREAALKPGVKRGLSVFDMVQIPLTEEENASISVPAEMALIRLKQNEAELEDMKTIWFRMRTTLVLTLSYHSKEVAAQVQPICDAWEAKLKAQCLANNRIPEPLTPEEIIDLDAVMELSLEVQHQTNRQYMLLAYQQENKRCSTLFLQWLTTTKANYKDDPNDSGNPEAVQ